MGVCFVYDLINGLLTPTHLKEVTKFMKNGGLCVLPSDSAYILTGLLSLDNNKMTKDLDTLLERNGMKMSLSISDENSAAQRMQLSNMAYNFIKQVKSEGITFVADPRNDTLNKFSKDRLMTTDGTIGIRISRSPVEVQLAKQNLMFPSTPIRDNSGKVVCTLKEAEKIVRERLTNTGINRDVGLIEGVVPYPGDLSTVVKEEYYNGFWFLRIIREGTITHDRVKSVALECQYKGILK